MNYELIFNLVLYTANVVLLGANLCLGNFWWAAFNLVNAAVNLYCIIDLERES